MRTAALPAAVLLALAGAWVPTTAHAVSVTDGQCTTDTGVTLVVDHQELGGGLAVKCVEDVPEGTSALGLLRLAGMTSEGTVSDGSGFVCRINGRPAPDETLTLAGDPSYRETCTNTPPQEAFWGYWHASPGGDWTYSSWGANSREVEPGGFEGFSFSMNHPSGENPPPGLTPSGSQAQPGPESIEPPVPTTPAREGSPAQTVMGIGVVAALALGGGLVWWRRRGQ